MKPTLKIEEQQDVIIISQNILNNIFNDCFLQN